jgi:hypothetical protein
LVARVVDCVVEGFVAGEDAGLEELFKTCGEGLGTAREVYQVVDVVVRVEGVGPGDVLVEWV